MAKLQDLITSRVRVKVLGLFFLNPGEVYYVREATRLIDEEINAVRRELMNLTKNGVLVTEDRGNRTYYRVNKAYPFFAELQQIVFKENGLGKKIRRLRRKLGKLDYVVFTPAFFNRHPKSDDLDILVIGEVVIPELEALIKEEEKKMGREINFAIFDANEFKFRKQRRDPFIMEVMYGKRLMIIGDEEAFVERGQFM
ncbi:hypothetical protein IJJ08_01655 [bacterium]|nr:hypothetical protein [bacterium]